MHDAICIGMYVYDYAFCWILYYKIPLTAFRHLIMSDMKREDFTFGLSIFNSPPSPTSFSLSIGPKDLVYLRTQNFIPDLSLI